MKNPLVSVIIPAYNVELYIKNAIESALNQTYKNIEIIVVDDGSTDNTRKVIEPYLKLGNVKYIYQNNKGLSGARNTGIKNSNGEFIALLDSDDEFLPEKIEKQLGFLQSHPECDICYCDIWHFREDQPDQLLKINYKYYSGKEVFENLLKKNFINPLSVVFHREVFDKFGYFNESYRQSEDWEYWLRLAYKGASFCFFPEILAKYRFLGKNNMQNFKNEPRMWKATLKVFKDLERKMSAEEKKKYRMKFNIFRYEVRYLWALLLSWRFFSFLRRFQQWRRSKRFRESIIP